VIREGAIARRYATALFGAAQNAGAAEAVLDDLGSLEGLEVHDPALQRFLEAPDVLTEQKVASARLVLESRVHPLVLRLLILMLSKKRIQHLPLVYQAYRDLFEESRGMARAQVTSAVPLDEAAAKELVTRLARLTGKQVRLEMRVDPAVLGGVVAVVGGQIVDGTLRHQLAELREQLIGTRVH
jgi:F-type H+-transporting ATPase subunit delta